MWLHVATGAAMREAERRSARASSRSRLGVEGTLQQCLNLGFPLVLAVCMLSMWGRGRMYSHPQHTMREAATTGRFLTNVQERRILFARRMAPHSSEE